MFRDLRENRADRRLVTLGLLRPAIYRRAATHAVDAPTVGRFFSQRAISARRFTAAQQAPLKPRFVEEPDSLLPYLLQAASAHHGV